MFCGAVLFFFLLIFFWHGFWVCYAVAFGLAHCTAFGLTHRIGVWGKSIYLGIALWQDMMHELVRCSGIYDGDMCNAIANLLWIGLFSAEAARSSLRLTSRDFEKWSGCVVT